MKRIIILLFLNLCIILNLGAQVFTRMISDGNQKSGYHRNSSLWDNRVIHRMASFDFVDFERGRRAQVGNSIGKGFDVNLTLSDGEWREVKDGREWSIVISSAGAYTLNFVLDQFRLPSGGYLEIVSKDERLCFGPVRQKDIPQNGHFLTSLIPGDEASIYLFEPEDHKGESSLVISRVVHGVGDWTRDDLINHYLGVSDSCNVNVACESDYNYESNAVCLIIGPNGDYNFTGALVMDSDKSLEPYVLTAFHCLDTDNNGILSNQEKAATQEMAFFFGWKYAMCDLNIYPIMSLYQGATFKSAWKNTDFALLKLNDDLSDNPYLTWLGWDRSGNTPTSGACIHHPKGDIMKISIEDDYLLSSGYEGNYQNCYWYASFDEGITQTGSSGAPLLNGSKKLVGQLHGGSGDETAPCEQTDAFCGKFSKSWDGGGTPDTRLKDWLNPTNNLNTTTNSGDVVSCMEIDGSAIPCGLTTYRIKELPSEFSVIWSWKFATPTLPITVDPTNPFACTVNRSDTAYFHNTLVATISQNGVERKRAEKALDSGANLHGSYLQDAFTSTTWSYPASGGSFVSGSTIEVNKGSTITFQSQQFIGATITKTGDAVLDWTVSGNTISFRVKYLPPDIIGPINPNSVAQPGIPAVITITGTYPNSCNVFQFTVVANDPLVQIILSQPYELTINNEGSNCTFSITQKRAEASVERQEVKDWRLEIINTTSGRTIFTGKAENGPFIVDISSWEDGIYAIRAIVGNEIITKKFMVSSKK